MRPLHKRAAWIASLALGLPLVLLLIVLVVSNTDPGRRAIERLTARLSDGNVVLSGLSGRFPGDLHIDRLELKDREGVWLTATDIELRSSAASLVLRHLDIERLSAGHVLLVRAPIPEHPSGSSGSYLTYIDVAELLLPRFEIGPALAGADTVLDAKGRVHLRGTDAIDAALSARRVDGPGRYELSGRLDATHLECALALEEPAGGPLQTLAGLPRLGELAAHLDVRGPRSAETTKLELAAGALRLKADGAFNWTDGNADFDVTGSSPAMAPAEAIAWQSFALDGHFHGKFSAPVVSARLELAEVRAGDARFARLAATVGAEAGVATLKARLEGLTIPGPEPLLFAEAPIEVEADAHHVDGAWQAQFSGAHPLATLSGRAVAGERPHVEFDARLPSIVPFASLGGVELDGRATVSGSVDTGPGVLSADLKATVEGVRGTGGIAGLIAPSAKLVLAGTRRGTTTTVDRFALEGGALRLNASGSDTNGTSDYTWDAELTRLAAFSAALTGTARARGRLEGPPGDFSVRATATVEGTAHTSERGVVEIGVDARGLPSRPAARLVARGTLDGAPLNLTASVRPLGGGGVAAKVDAATWRSAIAAADLEIPAASRPVRGSASLSLPNLAEFSRLAGVPLSGSAGASVAFKPAGPHGSADIHVEARDAGMPGHLVGHLLATGSIDSPTRRPLYDIKVAADAIVAAPLTGNARLDATGPADRLALALATHWLEDGEEVAGGSVAATLDIPAQRLEVATLEASARGQSARLLAPTVVRFRGGLSLEPVRIGTGDGTLEAAGRLAPTLDLTASLTKVTPAPLAAFFPDWPLDGAISADARLTGRLTAPEGTIHLHATGLRLRGPSGRAVPPTEIEGSVVLAASTATVDLNLHAGTAAGLAIKGQVPLQADRAYALHASGEFALATANPFLEPDGRRVKGQATIEGDLTGAAGNATVAGTLGIEHADFQDFARGAHLADVAVTVVAADRSVRITRFIAHAGAGTVTAEGTVGVLEPGVPVDVKLTAADAQPLATDLLTARLDGSITVKGVAATGLSAAGQLHITRAEINIPNALPREVARLDVRRRNAKPPPPPSWQLAPVALDVRLDAPRAVFVRGRGLDSELGGDLHVAGTYDSPQVEGGFDMRRGTLALAGASLKFSSGRVSFNGAGPKKQIDPTLDFVAENVSGDVTATLTVGGYASAPTIELTSSPELPQDEILSRLLFNSDAKQLTPLQMLGIGVALASISGVGYGGSDPLAAIQKRLGLDRLAVSGSSSGSGTASGADSNAATVEAGRYVSSRLYIGAVQSTTGVTKLQAQIDLTKHLKLQTAVGNGSATAQGTTPQNDPGNTVGLVYQIDY